MRHRTLRRALLFPMLGALALTACADDSDDGGEASGSDSCVTSADIETVVAEGDGGATDGGADGGGEATTPPAGEPTGQTYTIAFMGPLSGESPQLGINISNGAQLAVEQANDSGTLPFTLKFAQADDEGTPDKGPAAAQRLIDDPNVMAVIGPVFSGVTNAAEPLFGEAGLMSVSPSATLPALTESDFTTFARVVLPDTVQGSQAAEFMAEHAEKVYVIDDTTDYGLGLADEIETTLNDLDVEVVREGVVNTTQDYSSIAQKVVQEDVQAVYYAGYYQQAGPFAKALAAAGYECLAMSGDGSNDDQFMELAGADGEGWMFSCPCSDARSDPQSIEFNEAYTARFNADPGTFSPEAYDATNAVIHAMSGIEGEINRASVVEAVKAVDYQGLTKQIKFKENGDIDGETIFVYGVENGTRILKGTTPDLIQ